MLLERYDNLLNGRDVISDDGTLLGNKIDSRKAYFRRLNMGGGAKKKSFRSGVYRHGNLHSNKPISQRVLVKAHFKKHGVGGAGGSDGAGNLRGHLSYITRDGAGVEKERPALFGGAGDDLSRSDFYNLCKDDRHHFRFIISPENAHEIDDMQGYIRGVMEQVENDLGTKLGWVSAIHYDTDHPHAHVVVRGKDDLGKDLVIEPSYISHGIRMRAEELATEILGERSIEEIQKSMEKETQEMRVTSLDRFIAARDSAEEKDAGEIVVDTRENGYSGRGEFYDGLVKKRLEFLSTTSMAVQEPPGVFSVRLDYINELKEVSERHDIIKQLHRSMPNEEQGVLIYDASDKDAQSVRGRIEKIAFVNELTDHKYMVVRDGQERAHYVALANNERSDALLEGQIVEVSTGKSTGGADANIAFIASENGGVYTRDAHLEHVRSEMSFIEDPEGYVDYHGVRLQTLEKAGIVEQGDHGYVIPDDLEKRGEELNEQLEKSGWKKKSYARVKEICSKPVESQIDAHARTFLDLEIYRHQKGHDLSYACADKGTLDAMYKRMDWLVEHGYAYHREGDGRFVMKGDALKALEKVELDRFTGNIEKNFGLRYTEFDLSEPRKLKYIGHATSHSGKKLLVGFNNDFTVLNANHVHGDFRKNEPLIIQNTDKGVSVKTDRLDMSREEAIERAKEKTGMEHVDLSHNVDFRVRFLGTYNLKDSAYAVVTNDREIALVKTDEFPLYRKDETYDISIETDGKAKFAEVSRQRELELEQEKAKSKSEDKDIDIDW